MRWVKQIWHEKLNEARIEVDILLGWQWEMNMGTIFYQQLGAIHESRNMTASSVKRPD